MAIQRLSTIKNGFVYHYMGTCTQYIMLYCSMCHMLECLLGISPPSNTAWQPQVRVQWKFSLLHTPDLAFISFSTAALGPILLLVVVYIHLNSLYCFIFKRLWFLFYYKLTQFQSVYVNSNLAYMVSLFCLSVCMTVCLSVWLYVCLYDCMSVCMTVRLYVCMSVCLYVCMSVCLYDCMTVCLYECMTVCLYVCMSVCLYVCLLDVA